MGWQVKGNGEKGKDTLARLAKRHVPSWPPPFRKTKSLAKREALGPWRTVLESMEADDSHERPLRSRP
eukprot:5387138-Alexandrium_andersonii.AAC.1